MKNDKQLKIRNGHNFQSTDYCNDLQIVEENNYGPEIFSKDENQINSIEGIENSNPNGIIKNTYNIQGSNISEFHFDPNSQQIKITFHYTGNGASTSSVKNNMINGMQMPFWELYDKYLELKSFEYSYGFTKQMKSTRNNLKKFVGNKPISFNNIDVAFLEKFRFNYVNVLGNSKNSFAGTVKRLKFFLNYALKNGWTENNKFKDYTISEEYGKPIFLNWEELMILYNNDNKNKYLNLVRDLFVFQSVIGCRYMDLKSLKKENVENNILRFIAQKTNAVIEIPLSAIARGIISNYSNIPGTRLLPVMSNNVYNKYLKEIGIKAGLNRKVEMTKNGKKNLTPIYELMKSHMARRIFIGNAINKFNIRTEIIKSLTGHTSNSKSFARYYDIDIETKKNSIEMMN